METNNEVESSIDNLQAAELVARIARREELQAEMKAVNAAIRKSAKAAPEAQVAAILAVGVKWIREAAAYKLLQKDFAGRIGFPDYKIKNNGAEIRRLKARLASLQA